MRLFRPDLVYQRLDGQIVDRSRVERDVRRQLAIVHSARSDFRRETLGLDGEDAVEVLSQEARFEVRTFLILHRAWTVCRRGRYVWSRGPDGWRIRRVQILEEDVRPTRTWLAFSQSQLAEPAAQVFDRICPGPGPPPKRALPGRGGERTLTPAPMRVPPNPTMRVARLGAGYGAIVFMLPYLALKVAWLGGNSIGFVDESLVRRPGMIAANALSFGMDLVAVGLALTLTHRWGLRVPPWLVLFPMWVATGFLAPAVVIVPVAIIQGALASHSAPATDAMLQPWVGRVVGASFAGQGAALIVAFVLYVRTRWADLLQSSTGVAPRGPTHAVQVLLANLAALMAVAAGALHLFWAFGGAVGLGHRALSEPTAPLRLLNAIWGLLSIAGAAGILAMVHRWGRVRFKLLLALTWIGAGSLFAWGLWTLILVLPGIKFGRRAEEGMALANCLGFVKFTAGMLIGLATAVLLAERQAAIRSRAA